MVQAGNRTGATDTHESDATDGEVTGRGSTGRAATGGAGWRSLRSLLGEAGPWAVVAPDGSIAAACARISPRIGTHRTLVALVGHRQARTVTTAMRAALDEQEPVRVGLDRPLELADGERFDELVVTPSPLPLDGVVPVVVQLARRHDGVDDDDRVAELEAALARVRSMLLEVIDDGAAPAALPVAEPLPASLSDRRREVAVAVLEGRSVEEIATHLDLSPHTVRNHLKAVYRTLRVSSRAELQRRFHP